MLNWVQVRTLTWPLHHWDIDSWVAEPIFQQIRRVFPGIYYNFCEQAFGPLDWLFQSNPSMSAMRMGSLMMLKKNKTMDFLESLPDDRRQKMINKFRLDSRKFVKRYKESLDKLKQAKIEKIRKKEKNKSEEKEQEKSRLHQ